MRKSILFLAIFVFLGVSGCTSAPKEPITSNPGWQVPDSDKEKDSKEGAVNLREIF